MAWSPPDASAFPALPSFSRRFSSLKAFLWFLLLLLLLTGLTYGEPSRPAPAGMGGCTGLRDRAGEPEGRAEWAEAALSSTESCRSGEMAVTHRQGKAAGRAGLA